MSSSPRRRILNTAPRWQAAMPPLATFDTGAYHRISRGGDIDQKRRAGNAGKRHTAAGFALGLAVVLLSTACG